MSSSANARAGECQPLLEKDDASSSSYCCSGPVLVRILTCVTSIAEGYDISVISGAIIIMAKELALSKVEVGVIMGSSYLAMAVGCLGAGSLMESAGRKLSLCVSYAFLTAGSLIMAFGHSFLMLLTGRLTVGIGIAMGLIAVAAYIAEVSPADRRGLFSSAEEMFIVIGILLGYLANYMLLGLKHDWRYMLALGAVIPFIFMLLLLTPLFPESPRYLLLRGKVDEAKQVLAMLVSQDEVEQVMLQWKETQVSDSFSWARVLWPDGSGKRRAVFAGVGVGVSQLMTGIPIVGLCSSMMLEVELGTKQAFFQVLLVGAFRVVVAAIVTLVLVDNWGRRPLLLLSASGLALCCTFLAVAFHLQLSAIPWKLLGIYMFVCFYSIGIGPVGYTYMGEVLDSDVRGNGIALAGFLSRLFAAGLLMGFPTASAGIGIHGVFYFLASINATLALSFYIVVRETKLVPLETMWKVFTTPRASPKEPPASPTLSVA
mmetsp:Transcript_112466/g.195113  ORF Transcript_112466/g.195113 Transcript_112466/m.195113 type:complete len:487 (+) Transcript_112466:125-1585(+)